MMEEQTDWDIVVIGGGVVGCAVFRQFCLMGARTLLLEKGGDILSGASESQQRAAAHRLRCAHGSLELHCMQAGYGIYRHPRADEVAAVTHRRLKFVAWDEQQLAALPAIMQQAHDNGVLTWHISTPPSCIAVSHSWRPRVGGPVEVPGERDRSLEHPLAYLTQGVKHGGNYPSIPR